MSTPCRRPRRATNRSTLQQTAAAVDPRRCRTGRRPELGACHPLHHIGRPLHVGGPVHFLGIFAEKVLPRD